MKSIAEVLEEIRVLFPIYQTVKYGDKECTVVDIYYFTPIDGQHGIISIKVTGLGRYPFVKFKIDVQKMTIIEVYQSRYPGHHEKPLDLSKNISGIFAGEKIIY
jgi:hypothetical protein